MADFDGGPGDDVYNGDGGDNVANGNDGNDQLNGLGGNDQLNGGNGNDGANGGDGNDVIDGGNGADVMNGDAGDDTLVASGQTGFGFADTAHGGLGSDRLVMDWSATAGHLQNGSGPTANGTFGGFDGSFTDVDSRNVNYTSIEHFTIIGGADNDIITVATGDDIIQLGLGNDFVNVGSGNDTADGGDGVDGVSADMSTATTDILWDLQANTYSGPAGTSFANFEYFGTISTGSGNDVIVTTNAVRSEVINLGDGDDTATVVRSAPGGGETVNGGTGDDRLIIDWSVTAINAQNNNGPTVNGALGGFDGQFTDNSNVQVAYTSIEHFTIMTGAGNDNLTTASGDDVVSLGAGNDHVNVGSGIDQADGGDGEDGVSADMSSATGAILWDLQANTYSGLAGTSFTNFEYFGTLTTGSGNDVIVTRNVNRVETINLGAGDDSATVTGQTSGGSDTVNGGSGSDRLIIDWSAVTTQASNGNGPTANGALGGFDGNFSEPGGFKSVNYSSIEHFTIATGSGNDNITTASGDDVVSLGAGNDTVNLGAGINIADGGTGIDGFAADFSALGSGVSINLTQATSSGAFGSYSNFEYFLNVTGSSFADRFISGSQPRNDVIAMGAGSDLARVANGDDNVAGGGGSDTLIVDYDAATHNISTSVGSSADPNGYSGQISDGVGRRVTFSGIDRLEISTGSGNDNVQGAGGDDSISTGAGSDTLSGLAGNDLLDGGAGDDTYFVNDPGDQAIETAAGDGAFDLVRSQVSFTLGDFVENLVLTGTGANSGTGNSLANVITGNNSANVLNGGGASDKLVGKGGDDFYIVDRAGDKVVEDAGGGDDTVQSSVTYTLPANVENLILTGAAAINGTGNFGANTLTGNDATNALDGGAGADTMIGGGGNDTYFVDSVGDQAIEAAGGGTDVVRSKVSFTLGDFVENLTLTGSLAINGTGNALANTLNGNSGANILDGGIGADKLNGKNGDDTYVVDDAGDLVSEDSATGGTDLVLSSVTFTLGTHVDNLTLTGAAAIDGTGNATANTITGNGAANILSGGAGDDTLDGGTGDDELRGGAGNDLLKGQGGADRFVFDTALAATNVDHVELFQAGTDKIVLENAVFTGLPFGALNPSALRIGTAAGDANDRIIYDPATGNLYFDSDGTGAAAQMLFAVLDNQPATLSASDFSVI